MDRNTHKLHGCAGEPGDEPRAHTSGTPTRALRVLYQGLVSFGESAVADEDADDAGEDEEVVSFAFTTEVEAAGQAMRANMPGALDMLSNLGTTKYDLDQQIRPIEVKTHGALNATP